MRGSLNKIDGVAKIDIDTGGRTCTFMVPKDLDVNLKLAEVSAGNAHLEGYIITSGGSPAANQDEIDEDHKTNSGDQTAKVDAGTEAKNSGKKSAEVKTAERKSPED